MSVEANNCNVTLPTSCAALAPMSIWKTIAEASATEPSQLNVCIDRFLRPEHPWHYHPYDPAWANNQQ